MRIFRQWIPFSFHVQVYSFHVCPGPGSGCKPLSIWVARNPFSCHPVCGHVAEGGHWDPNQDLVRMTRGCWEMVPEPSEGWGRGQSGAVLPFKAMSWLSTGKFSSVLVTVLTSVAFRNSPFSVSLLLSFTVCDRYVMPMIRVSKHFFKVYPSEVKLV